MSFGKRCSKCRRNFHPVSGFYHASHSWCRSCVRVYLKGYRRRVRLVALVRAALAS
jgi:hypothetical protein